MKTKEEIASEWDVKVEALKTENGGEWIFGVRNNADGVEERYEYSDSQYEQHKIDQTENEWQEQQFGYIRERQMAYPSILDFIEAYTEKEIGEDDTKWTAYVEKYNKVRADHPKPE